MREAQRIVPKAALVLGSALAVAQVALGSQQTLEVCAVSGCLWLCSRLGVEEVVHFEGCFKSRLCSAWVFPREVSQGRFVLRCMANTAGRVSQVHLSARPSKSPNQTEISGRGNGSEDMLRE